jgi:pyocin large subunit-like protein
VAGQIWTPDPNRGLNPAESAYVHWGDHGSDFPQHNNAKQYAEEAKYFLNNSHSESGGKVRRMGM